MGDLRLSTHGWSEPRQARGAVDGHGGATRPRDGATRIMGCGMQGYPSGHVRSADAWQGGSRRGRRERTRCRGSRARPLEDEWRTSSMGAAPTRSRLGRRKGKKVVMYGDAAASVAGSLASAMAGTMAGGAVTR